MAISIPFIPWSCSRLEDEIFINLMENGRYGKDGIQNKYVDQFEYKFQFLRLGTSIFEISFKNLNEETTFHIKDYTTDCKTPGEAYQKLNGIIPDVIARIAKQAEHRILAKSLSDDQVLLKTALNSIRELASNHWKFIA